MIPGGEEEDGGRCEDGDGDDVSEAADVAAVIVVWEGEEELAPARAGHAVRVAAEPLENGKESTEAGCLIAVWLHLQLWLFSDYCSGRMGRQGSGREGSTILLTSLPIGK